MKPIRALVLGISISLLSCPLALPVDSTANREVTSEEAYFDFFVATSPRKINWDTPRDVLISFFLSQRKENHTSHFKLHGMGHGMGHFRCRDTAGRLHEEFTAITGQNTDKVDDENLWKKHLGLKVLFLGYDDAYIEPSEEIEWNIAAYRGRRERPHNMPLHLLSQNTKAPVASGNLPIQTPMTFLRFPISTAAQCDAMLDYYNAFRNRANSEPEVEHSRPVPNFDHPGYSEFLRRARELMMANADAIDKLGTPEGDELEAKLGKIYEEAMGAAAADRELLIGPVSYKRLWFGTPLRPYDLYNVWKKQGGDTPKNYAFLGGSCTSYIIGFLQVVGMMDPVFESQFLTDKLVQHRLIGGEKNPVSPLRLVYSWSAGTWNPPHDRDNPLAGKGNLWFWDPERIWKFMDALGSCVEEDEKAAGVSSSANGKTIPHFNRCQGFAREWYQGQKSAPGGYRMKQIQLERTTPYLAKNPLRCAKPLCEHPFTHKQSKDPSCIHLNKDMPLDEIQRALSSCKDSFPVYGVKLEPKSL